MARSRKYSRKGSRKSRARKSRSRKSRSRKSRSRKSRARKSRSRKSRARKSKSGKKSKRRSARKSGRRSGKPLFRGEFKCNIKRSPTNDKKDLIKELRGYVNCVEKKTTINQDMSLERLRGESVSDIKRHLKFYRDSY
jgi:hypothetical protein